MTVLAIDPGSEQSAYVVWNGGSVRAHGKLDNTELRNAMRRGSFWYVVDHCVIEQIASYGMAVGAEVFATAHWSGRFFDASMEAIGIAHLMPRKDVKLHLCGSMKAKDSNIRQALIDRFGGKEKAIGRKASPGPLHGLRADEWQALALAVTFHDRSVAGTQVGAVVTQGGVTTG